MFPTRLFLFASAAILIFICPPSLRAELRAGAATANITPPLGGDIVGGFSPFPATHIHDELHARCIVLDDGKTRIAMVVCDLLGLHRSLCVEAKKHIQEQTGIPHTHVMISGTHTHSGTNTVGTYPRTYTSDLELNDYQLFVARRIADGVRRATNLLRPAELAFTTVDVPEHLHNRRWFMKPGTVPVNPFGSPDDKVKMNPPSGSENLIEPAGPIDPTISILALREPGGRFISLLSAYSLHYVGGVGSGHVSADYYGMFCDKLQQMIEPSPQDPPFVAIMANGTSGDINNVNFRQPRPKKEPYEQMRYVAHDVAEKVFAAVQTLEWQAEADLDARYRELDIAWRKVEPELLEWAQTTEQNTPRIQSKTNLPLAYAQRVQKLAEASPETQFPAQLFRIGDIAIGFSPCETFAETGLEFRQRSPFKKAFMIELANGYYGYMPTPRHFELGGYETWPGTNNLEPQASVKLMDTLLEMAAETKVE